MCSRPVQTGPRSKLTSRSMATWDRCFKGEILVMETKEEVLRIHFGGICAEINFHAQA